MAISGTLVGFISLLKDFGYSSYIIQQPHISENEIVSINTRVVILGVAAFLATSFLAIPLCKFYNQVQLLWILPIMGSLFILNSFILVPQALMRRNMEFGKIGKIDVGSNLATVITGVILLLFIRSYWVLLISSVFNTFFQIVFTYKFNSWKFQLSNPYTNKISPAGSIFGRQLTIFNVMTFVSINLDRILIGKFAGNVALGNYSKSFEFGCSNVDRLIRKPLLQVYFSDLSGKNVDEKCRLFYQYLYLLVSMLLMVVGPALILTEWIVNNFLSTQWKPLINMLPPFLLCSFFFMSMSLADQLLIATSRLKRYLFLGVSKAITGSLAILIASFWGAEAVAWSFLIYHVLLFIPFCSTIFSGINKGNTKAKSMIIDTCIIVFSATFSTLIPYVLNYYYFLDIKLALVLYILIIFLLFFVLWPRIKYFDSFKIFFRNLIAFKITKASLII